MELEEQPRGTDKTEHTQAAQMDLEESSSEDEAPLKEEHTKSFLELKLDSVSSWLSLHSDQIRQMFKLLFAAGYVAMLVAACVLNFQRASVLLIVSAVVALCWAWDPLCAWLHQRSGSLCLTHKLKIRKSTKTWIRRVLLGLLPVPVLVLVGLNTARSGPGALISFCGLLLLIFILMIFSMHPFRWSWHTIICGVSLQFYLALLVTRTTAVKRVLKAVGDKVQLFMSFSDKGAEFVFGPNFMDHLFAFKVMPILVFMSTVISILQYSGILSWLIGKIGFIMQFTIGTSPIESMAAAANIFLGQLESVALIRPYVSKLTSSELHAMMTGGFASISGSVLGIYIALGIDPTHLLTASVMSSPASLVMAKTLWPETETSQTTTDQNFQILTGCRSVLEAACQGASSAAELVGQILANIISVLALLAFTDSLLSWIGSMFDYPELSVTLICSYVFMPLSFMMGVSWEDSFIVAGLIGKKTFVNEFVAYHKLSEFIERRRAGGPEYVDNVKQYLSERSETIATYALCGFSSVSSLGMMLGLLNAIVPERLEEISRCGLRALIAGSFSCFATACIAGILFVPELQCSDLLSSAFNTSQVLNTTHLLSCCTQLYHSVTGQVQPNSSLAPVAVSSVRVCCLLSPSPHLNCSQWTTGS